MFCSVEKNVKKFLDINNTLRDFQTVNLLGSEDIQGFLDIILSNQKQMMVTKPKINF